MAAGKVLAVGDSVRSQCTKCKTVTRHTVISVVGGKAAKVQCVACQGFHNYRDPAGPPPRGATPKAAGAAKGERALRTLEEEWLAQMRGRDPKQALAYGEKQRPQAGDLVEHPSFGYGLVRKVILPNRVEIHFRNGIRLMRWDF